MPLTSTLHYELNQLYKKNGELYTCPKCNTEIPFDHAEVVELPTVSPLPAKSPIRAIAQFCPKCGNLRLLSLNVIDKT